MQESKREKRKAQRLPIPLRVVYRPKGSRQKFKEAVNENISGLGIRLLLDEALAKNSLVTVLFCSDDSTKKIRALCRVRWCRRSGRNKFQAGLKFEEIKEYFYFSDFLCDKILDSSLKNK